MEDFDENDVNFDEEAFGQSLASALDDENDKELG